MIVKLRKIVEDHSYEILKWPCGGELAVDVQSANVVVKAYDSLNREQQYKMQAFMNESQYNFNALVSKCWELVS